MTLGILFSFCSEVMPWEHISTRFPFSRCLHFGAKITCVFFLFSTYYWKHLCTPEWFLVVESYGNLDRCTIEIFSLFQTRFPGMEIYLFSESVGSSCWPILTFCWSLEATVFCWLFLRGSSSVDIVVICNQLYSYNLV